MSFASAGSGRSMARLLMAVLVCAFSLSMVFLAWRHGVFNASEAAAIGTLATALGGVWGLGKWKAPVGVAAPSAPGVETSGGCAKPNQDGADADRGNP